jgi:hypothetical protein
MHQQLWGYKVEDKIYLGVRERKRLNITYLYFSLAQQPNDSQDRQIISFLNPQNNTPQMLWTPMDEGSARCALPAPCKNSEYYTISAA